MVRRLRYCPGPLHSHVCYAPTRKGNFSVRGNQQNNLLHQDHERRIYQREPARTLAETEEVNRLLKNKTNQKWLLHHGTRSQLKIPYSFW